MDERWIRGIAVFGGAIASILVVTGIMYLTGGDDDALATTWVALGSGSFAIALRDWLRARFPRADG